MPSNKNLDLINSDKLNKMPSRIRDNHIRYQNVDITYLDSDSRVPIEVISEEQRLVQVMMIIIFKILRTTVRAQITIDTKFIPETKRLKVIIKENGNIFGKDQIKL